MSSCNEFTRDGKDNGKARIISLKTLDLETSVNNWVQIPANIIEDQLDYHNMFVGQYYMGDVTYKGKIQNSAYHSTWSDLANRIGSKFYFWISWGLKSVNNAHGMYWKRSKNFADRKSYHIEDSLFLTAAGEKNTLKLYYIVYI